MDRKSYAKERAGYAPEDVPMEPRRSAYTDDMVGEGAYRQTRSRNGSCSPLSWPPPQ